MKKVSLQVCVSNKQCDVPIRIQSVKNLVLCCLQYWKVSTDQVYVYFLDDEALAKLHDEVFSDPSLTDTITLPIDPPQSTSRPHILGEAFISPKAAIRFLQDRAEDSGLLYEEISRYVVHSLLHMLGYDDQTPEERKKMRGKENQALCMLREKHALLSD
ncbi:rRNA maturation RNase YbeY [Chlamydia buteonis]|uniref:Endoribonuclease YbeY n=1 Tax=Chlamydia buteonis TaxID=2494525 RepID=A0ABX8L909_9CHLA|nr:rRNA maturation RNase YbeY [Chlamydia buteonis]QXE27331.1 rRNA maturation RNase YbeY [Chlamydia buteonis]QXE27767.1 rRNA maturation RNase YbeY [Chlamydia buteonis]